MVKKQAPEEGVSAVYPGSALSSKALIFSLNELVRKLLPHLHGVRVSPVSLLSGQLTFSNRRKSQVFLVIFSTVVHVLGNMYTIRNNTQITVAAKPPRSLFHSLSTCLPRPVCLEFHWVALSFMPCKCVWLSKLSSGFILLHGL